MLRSIYVCVASRIQALADIDEASFSDRFRADVVTVLQGMGVAYVGAIQVAVSQIEADVNDEVCAQVKRR